MVPGANDFHGNVPILSIFRGQCTIITLLSLIYLPSLLRTCSSISGLLYGLMAMDGDRGIALDRDQHCF